MLLAALQVAVPGISFASKCLADRLSRTSKLGFVGHTDQHSMRPIHPKRFVVECCSAVPHISKRATDNMFW